MSMEDNGDKHYNRSTSFLHFGKNTIGTARDAGNMVDIARHCVTSNLLKNELIAPILSNTEHLYDYSQTFDFDPLFDKYDMVCVDGAHHYQSVKKDTGTAFKLMKGERSIIV